MPDIWTRNMGQIDRLLRIALALVLLWLAFGAELAWPGVLRWIAAGVAGIFLVTSLIGSCPLYTLLGFRTCRTR